MTASVEVLLARLGPKSTATYYEAAVTPQRGPAAQRSATASHPKVVESHSDFFAGIPAGLLPAISVSADAECCENSSRMLTHFNVRMFTELAEQYARDLVRHCDFRSVPLPEFASVWESVRATQSDWQTVLGFLGGAADDDPDDDALLDLTYVESTYTPRPRNLKVLKNVPVRVDPNATRPARVYTAEDAEGWVR